MSLPVLGGSVPLLIMPDLLPLQMEVSLVTLVAGSLPLLVLASLVSLLSLVGVVPLLMLSRLLSLLVVAGLLALLVVAGLLALLALPHLLEFLSPGLGRLTLFVLIVVSAVLQLLERGLRLLSGLRIALGVRRTLGAALWGHRMAGLLLGGLFVPVSTAVVVMGHDVCSVAFVRIVPRRSTPRFVGRRRRRTAPVSTCRRVNKRGNRPARNRRKREVNPVVGGVDRDGSGNLRRSRLGSGLPGR